MRATLRSRLPALIWAPRTAIKEQGDEAREGEHGRDTQQTGAKRARRLAKMADPIGAEAAAEISDGVDQSDGARRGGSRE